jgi:sugar lactone lactonase YvrE
VLLAGPAFGQSAKVSILVDLDPARVDRSIQVESITADASGLLYIPDAVTGNILRIDPSSPKPVVVGRIPSRAGANLQTGANGLGFDARGDLYIAKASYGEVLRIRKDELNPDRPGVATTFATGTTGANGIAFDRHGYAFVTGTATGRIYRVSPGGEVTLVAELATLETVGADGVPVRGPGPNGVAVDASGTVHVTNTSLGEIWRIDVRPDGTVGTPALWVKSPLLQRIDGIAFDAMGTAWLASQRNAIITVSRNGEIREVAANGSDGPLQVPTGIVFVGAKAYVNNYDTVPAPNGNGKTSEGGIGSSIALIEP